MTEPLVHKIHAPGGKVVVVGVNYGTIDLREVKKLVPRFVDVPLLPPQPIVGREQALNEVRRRLCGPDRVAAIAGLHGSGGVGKTTVAVAIAWDREILRHFRAGVLWTGLGPHGDVDRALDRWAAALGVELSSGSSVMERAGLLSLALQAKAQGEPVLLVIDDVWTRAQIDPFKKIAFPGCAHLMTTRNTLLAQSFAGNATRIEALPEVDAEEVVAGRCPEALKADPEGFRELVRAVGGLPLGLTLIAQELARHAGQASWIRSAIERLASVKAKLALETTEERPGLEGVPNTLQAIVEMSVLALSNEEQDSFAALGALAPKPADFSREAALAIWDLTDEQGDERLRVLVGRGLLELAGENRFSLHQVPSAIAVNRLATERGARERHAVFYRMFVEASPEDWQRIVGELEQIRHAWSWIIGKTNMEAEVVAYIDAINTFYKRRGLPQEWLAWLQRGLEAAQSLRSRRDEASMLLRLGLIHYHMADIARRSHLGSDYDYEGALARALEHHQQALTIFRELGDRTNEVGTLINIANTYSSKSEKARALEYYERALPLFRALGERLGEATALTNIGTIHSDLGEKVRALQYYEQALPLFRVAGSAEDAKAGAREGAAQTLENIGAVHHALEDWARAIEYYEQALALYSDMGMRVDEARLLNLVAMIRGLHGTADESIKYLERAIELEAATEGPNAKLYSMILQGFHKMHERESQEPSSPVSPRSPAPVVTTVVPNGHRTKLNRSSTHRLLARVVVFAFVLATIAAAGWLLSSR